jgi:hypothetical protein
VLISQAWADFFTMIFVSPDKFEWAKGFLRSSSWECLLKNESSEAMLPFSLPNRCHVHEQPKCSNLTIEDIMVVGTEEGEDGFLSGNLEPDSSNLLPPVMVMHSLRNR